jgi:predicted Zn-dependent protease
MEPDKELLVEGARLVSQGKRQEGRDLLMKYLEQDENNEEGWLWLSGAVDDPADMETALENCLSINPQNERAIQGKRWVEAYKKRLELEKLVGGGK